MSVADAASRADGGLRAPGTPAVAHVVIDELGELGVLAVVTTRVAGSLSVQGPEPVGAVTARWRALRTTLDVAGREGRFATATQVHGTRVIAHRPGWAGWLRTEEADGHFSAVPGTAFGVTVADCVPIFLVHPSGATALLHSGWRGTAGGILSRALDLFIAHDLDPSDVHAHFGPAICGRCYEVGPDVHAAVTGRPAPGPTCVDLRSILADQARAAGVRSMSTSLWCTRCDNELFFSHRAGDTGRQVAALIARR